MTTTDRPAAAPKAAPAPTAAHLAAPPAAPKRPRDLRLDFFRGLAMFIILLAHTPGNTWTLWIPARFGFSDATEIFVFCSGMASALAFGAAYRDRGWAMGTARILFRIWQVYWAHISLVFAVTALMVWFNASGWGDPDVDYMATLPLIPWREQFDEAITGLLTLTWVPNYFDILPMYLGILAMVPMVMAAHRTGGRGAVAVVVLGVWAVAQTGALDLPSRPWNEIPWFFNPFGWQLIFFTGFSFGMGWIPAPPRSRALAWACAGFLLLSLPFAWWKLHEGVWLPEGWLAAAVHDGREALHPLWDKSPFGFLRYAHFLALGYIAWMWAGEKGAALREPLPLPHGPRPAATAALALIALATIPYAWAQEIRWLSPALDAAILSVYGDGIRALTGGDLLAPDRWIGIPQIIHAASLGGLAWRLLGHARRDALRSKGWALFVELVRRVGSQSLAVFLTSMALAQVGGFVLDVIGRDVWTRLLVNLTGFALLIVTASVVGWFKRQPWRPERAKPAATAPARDEQEKTGGSAALAAAE